MNQVLLGMLVVGVVGFVLNLIAARLAAHSLTWRGNSTAQY
jgi:sulfonate transport system permease protein